MFGALLPHPMTDTFFNYRESFQLKPRAMSTESVNIVIPVYRNLQLTRRCIESVLADLPDKPHYLTIINDASPEQALKDFCEDVAEHPRVTLIQNDENLGFVASANLGMMSNCTSDVVLLNSDTEVPQGWLSRIQTASRNHPNAATLTPFSNNGTICSYPRFCEPNPLPKSLTVGEIDRFFAVANTGRTCEIPTAVGFCMYIRRAALSEVGLFDLQAFGRGYGEENDFCLRASAQGWTHMLVADVFVYHEGGASFGKETPARQSAALKIINQRYPLYSQTIADFIERDPIASFRSAVDFARLTDENQKREVLSEYQTQLQETRAERKALEKEYLLKIENLSDYAAQQASQARELLDERKTLQALVEQADEQLKQYEDQSERYQELLQESRTHSEKLEKQCEKFNQRCEQYQELLEESRDENRKLEEQGRQYEERCQRYDQLLADGQRYREELEEQCRQYDQRCQRYDQLLADGQRYREELEEQSRQYEQRCQLYESLRDEYEQYREQLETQCKEYETLLTKERAKYSQVAEQLTETESMLVVRIQRKVQYIIRRLR